MMAPAQGAEHVLRDIAPAVRGQLPVSRAPAIHAPTPVPSVACLAAIAALLALPACNDRNNMYQGARLKPLESAPSDPGHPATDVPPEGTVPRGPGPFDPADKPPLTLALLTRGRGQFDAFCAPCHARDGYSDGIIVRHGFPKPPSLHDADIRARDDEHCRTVIVHGLGKMPPYGALVRPLDQWAVIAYIRALQLSQNAAPQDIPSGAIFQSGLPGQEPTPVSHASAPSAARGPEVKR